MNSELITKLLTWCMAEGVGFEPTSPFGEAVFKTAALNHSAIPPQSYRYALCAKRLASFLNTFYPIEVGP